MTKSEILQNNKIDIVNMYNSGLPIRKIGDKYKCSQGLIYTKLEEWKIEIRRCKKYSDTAKQRIYPLIEYMSNNLNYGTPRISNILQCSQSFVHRAFKKLNIDYSHRVPKTNFLDHKEVCKLYLDGLSINEIANKLTCSQITVFKILKKNTIDRRPLNKYTFKKDILENGIITSELAWLWGLWLTDGNVIKGRIKIGMCDLDVIEKLKAIFEYTGPLYHRNDRRTNRKEIHELCINSVKLAQSFINLGCMANKTHKIEYPFHISDELTPFFLRGVLEGDGSISRFNCSITGNFPLLEGIIKASGKIGLKREDFYIYCRHPERKNNIRSITLNKRNAKKFLDWIYSDSQPHMRMDRKYAKYCEYYRGIL